MDKSKGKSYHLWSEGLFAVLDNLSHTEDKEKAKENFKEYITAQARELQPEYFARFLNELVATAKDRLSNAPTLDKLGALMTISLLIEMEHHEQANPTQLANCLTIALQSSDQPVLQLAATTLGRLAQASSSVMAIFVDYEIKNALRWIENKHEHRRHAAVLVLKELAEHVPTLFYVHVESFFQVVPLVINDAIPTIRLVSAAALRAALVLIAERENRSSLAWYHKIIREAHKGLESGNNAHIHGSLLTLVELLNNTGAYMKARYEEVCDTFMKHKDSKDKHIRRAVISTLPDIAGYSTKHFLAGYITTFIEFLLAMTQKDRRKDRELAFIAISKLAPIVSTKLLPYLKVIIERVQAALNPKSRYNCTASLVCLRMLVEVLGDSSVLSDHIHDLIEMMLSQVGLDPLVTETLSTIAENVPRLLPMIQERLLNHMSVILAGKPFAHPKISERTKGAVTSSVVPLLLYKDVDKKALNRLALQTMATFKLDVSILAAFLQETIVGYLDDDDEDIRHDAVRTCSSLLTSMNGEANKMHRSTIGEVVEKLLVVGISDSSPAIRKTVLSSFSSPNFDHHLASAINLRSLFVALNDQNFEIRELAITTIGRVTVHNPAHAMPALRKILIQLITGLNYSGNSCTEEESAVLIGHLARASGSLVRPYMDSLIEALLPKLKSNSSRVTSSVLATLGELSRINGAAVAPHIHQLLPLIIDTLQCQSSVSKREVALRTLGYIVRNTGYVIEPFLDYPQLMDMLLNAVKVEQVPVLRKEVVKVLGILGALDTYRHGMNQLGLLRKNLEMQHVHEQQSKDSGKQSNNSKAAGPAAHKRNNTSSDRRPTHFTIVDNTDSESYYLALCINVLLKMIKNPSLHSLHKGIIGTFMRMIKGTDAETAHPFLSDILKAFFEILRLRKKHLLAERISNGWGSTFTNQGGSSPPPSATSRARSYVTLGASSPLPQSEAPQPEQYDDYEFYEYLFQELALVVRLAKHHARNHLSDMLALINEYWNTPLFFQIIVLMEEVAVALDEEFKTYLPELIPHMLSVLYYDCRYSGDGIVMDNVTATSDHSGPHAPKKHTPHHSRDYLLKLPSMSSVGKVASLGLASLSTSPAGSTTSDTSQGPSTPTVSPTAWSGFGLTRIDSVLHCLEAIGKNLEEYLHLVIPAVVKLFENEQMKLPITAQISAIQTLGSLCSQFNHSVCLNQFASRIIHPLTHTLGLPQSYFTSSSVSHLNSGTSSSASSTQVNAASTSSSLSPSSSSSSSTASPQLGNQRTIRTKYKGVTSSLTGSKEKDGDVLFHSLRAAIMDTLCSLILQLEADFAIFIPKINKIITKEKIHHSRYETLVSRLLKNQPLQEDSVPLQSDSAPSADNLSARDSPSNATASDTGADDSTSPTDQQSGAASQKKLKLNEVNLRDVWKTDQRTTKDDWEDWIRRLSIGLLKESPSPSLRHCLSLAQLYHPLARELFNAAFVACWRELSPQYRDQFTYYMDNALNSPSMPNEILQVLLNLAEFIERDCTVQSLPIPVKTLGGIAEKCAAWAKALHYQEVEFEAACAQELGPSIHLRHLSFCYTPVSGAANTHQQHHRHQRNRSEGAPSHLHKYKLVGASAGAAEQSDSAASSNTAVGEGCGDGSTRDDAQSTGGTSDKMNSSEIGSVCEALISINYKLDLPSAAVGVLNYLREQLSIEVKESWYEKLQDWDTALHIYEEKEEQLKAEKKAAKEAMTKRWRQSHHDRQREEDLKYAELQRLFKLQNMELLIGRMRCLNALAEWDSLTKLSEKIWKPPPLPPPPTALLSLSSSWRVAASPQTARRSMPSSSSSFSGGIPPQQQQQESSVAKNRLSASFSVPQKRSTLALSIGDGSSDAIEANSSKEQEATGTEAAPPPKGIAVPKTPRSNQNREERDLDVLHCKRKIAPLLAGAAWNLGQWLKMKDYVAFMPEDSMDGAFYRAVLAIHDNNYAIAQMYIDRTRDLVDIELRALVAESYNRAYRLLVKVQQLAEMEEILEYKQTYLQQEEAFGLERRKAIVSIWNKRLYGMRRAVDVWHDVLVVRSLVLSPVEDMDNWIKLASLHRKKGHMRLSQKILEVLSQQLSQQRKLVNCVDNDAGGAGDGTAAGASVDEGSEGCTAGRRRPLLGDSRGSVAIPAGFTSMRKPSVDASVEGRERRCSTLTSQQLQIGGARSRSESGRSPLATLGAYCETQAGNHSGLSVEQCENFPVLAFVFMKHQWDMGQRTSSLSSLRNFIQSNKIQDTKLLARCHLTLGLWETELNDSLSEKSIPSVLASFKAATEYDKNWYKAWHAWALCNFEVVSNNEKLSGPLGDDCLRSKQRMGSTVSVRLATPIVSRPVLSAEALLDFIIPAARGFFRSLSLAPKGNSLQDTLRLLNLWFRYGEIREVEEALLEGFGMVNIDNWLQVIPQLIARIDSPKAKVASMISQLLSDLGERHPQALVFPLSVAAKSESQSRANAANRVLETMRVHGEGLVEAALLVSKELIRVAIPWYDLWHESLLQAWSVYSVNNKEGLEPMLQLLQSLHAELRRGAETPAEVAFLQAYGRELREAEEWCTLYQTSRNHGDLSQAWDLYCRVFLSLKTQLPQITTLHLSAASPKLLGVRDVELAVPGTYGQGSSVVTIQSFLPKLNIIKSKQRPRRVSILGSDGKEYPFLLKGHEDLRQDERVMQLFSLINTLLANDRETASRHLSIKRYAIIPLSPHSGLIEWVPNHDTLNTLIVDYRKAKNIPTDAEYHALLLMASNWKAGMKLAALNADYFKLALMQKVEVFENALSKTEGKDLNQVLWLKSPNAEMWLERRTNFTRSLAVMSMVGYVLGLGDRHPSNIMLDRHTGKITHIDFGDCFEVAMTRDKLPEKVPFRLTRMLVNAMEVSGIEGNFRFTCESVMRVLREHKESVMAVLEAFVYDPLINWRLLHPEKNAEEVARPPDGTRGRNASLAAVVAEDEVGDLPVRASYLSLVAPEKVAQQNEEGLNKRALDVVNRISAKLKGKDFGTAKPLDVAQQVQRLVFEATSVENLCQAYEGWRAFW